jgi:uncharacterized protein (TIGR02145 family)
MSLNKLKTLLIVAAFACVAIVCKKDEESEYMPSLSGMWFNCPEYVAQYTTLTFTPREVEHPDGKGVGYYWKVTPTMSKTDTTKLENGLSPDGKESDGSFTFKFSDTLKTYTVTGYAFADGYSGNTYTRKVTVVKGGQGGSITNNGVLYNTPTISIDGIKHPYAQIGDLDWLLVNLAVPSAGGAAYQNYEVTSDVFGRYYSYEEAKTACPEGWRLPTDAELVAVCQNNGGTTAAEHAVVKNVAAKVFANADFNGKPMLEYWPEVGDITNISKLSLIPVGYSNLGTKSADGSYNAAMFDGMNKYSVIWTADMVEGSSELAYYRYVIDNQPDMFIGKGDVKSFGASVRCVR